MADNIIEKIKKLLALEMQKQIDDYFLGLSMTIEGLKVLK